MTSVIAPQEMDVPCLCTDERALHVTSVVTPQAASKALAIFWAFLLISGGLLLCLFLMNGMCCSA
ncbi:MAG: hypothetical protein JO051_13080 [Acidobacteriaceae bacterium]|nr:hypothetical protein [Acidobacteriaceae bacterium]